MKTLQTPCIVCGKYITWDDSPLPAACAVHPYKDVFEAYDNMPTQYNDAQSRQAIIDLLDEAVVKIGLDPNGFTVSGKIDMLVKNAKPRVQYDTAGCLHKNWTEVEDQYYCYDCKSVIDGPPVM